TTKETPTTITITTTTTTATETTTITNNKTGGRKLPGPMLQPQLRVGLCWESTKVKPLQLSPQWAMPSKVSEVPKNWSSGERL
ncbi:hypothetical protein Tco_0166085, partial [Tanacetum coccineum]